MPVKVKSVKGYRCPECDEFIAKEDMPELESWYRCGECDEVYEDIEDAKECCRD